MLAKEDALELVDVINTALFHSKPDLYVRYTMSDGGRVDFKNFGDSVYSNFRPADVREMLSPGPCKGNESSVIL